MKNILYLIALMLFVSCIQQSEKENTDTATYFRNKPLKFPLPYKSENIEFGNIENNIVLKGTLTYPISESKSYPAVVLVHGYGRRDRDYTNNGHKTFLVMADYLSRNGIAVLRYDKRGCGESGGDFDKASYDDFASDAWSAVQYLNNRKEINFNTTGVAGHSEGGSVVPILASKHKLDYLILLAAPGLPYPVSDSLYSAGIAKARGFSDQQIIREAQVNDTLISLALNMELGQPLNDSIYNVVYRNRKDLSWLRELEGEKLDEEIQMEYLDYYATPSFKKFWEGPTPEEYLKQIKCPILSIGGSLDLNVPGEANVAAINEIIKNAGNTDISSNLIPNLNHNLQPAKTGLPEEAHSIEITIAPEVLILMKDFIQKQAKKY